tara:strand:+ start:561 stop:1451 length:891 start_codon:yes stop_codon:yes gene_type:complete
MKFSFDNFLTSVKSLKKNDKVTHLVMYNNISPLPGAEIGIPINIFENIFTQLHYGEQIQLPYFIVISCLIGYVTYGTDRFFDSLEYYNNDFTLPVSEKKEKLYKYMYENQNFIKSSLVLSNIILFYILSKNEETIPFIFLLFISNFYKQIKKEFGLVKAPFIGIMWMLSSVILPCVLYEHNYNILNDPTTYLPAFFSLFAASNTADISDKTEDEINKIETIPVKFGEKKSAYLNIILLLISSILFGINDNYQQRPIINTLFELNNLGTSLINLKVLNGTNINVTDVINPGNYTINI